MEPESKVEKKNLLHVVKSNDLMELFPMLLNKNKDEWKISPSEFIREITLSTEERHKELIYMSTMHPMEATDRQPGISVIPRIVVFQSFEIRKMYTLQVQVRNNGKVLLPLKMICPQSTYFSARFSGVPNTRVAPGLSVEYEVIFTPKDLKDYSHILYFKTETEMFSIPIVAIGPRPLLDIPDEITVDPAPVKISKSKIVIVRNIGMVPADFNFVTKGCFKVKPAKGTINVQELLQVSIIFESPVTGSYTETLYLYLETGEKLSIMLHGSAENISVRLDKNIIVHDDTFVGLKRSKVFHIQNNSQSLIKFSWKRNKTLKDDLDVIDKMRDKYELLKDTEVLKNAKQEYYNLCSQKTHDLAWERILSDELRLLQREEFQFQHPSFKIVPENGELFPRTQAKILAVFEPTSCGLESANAYLEVSGRDERLTLQMKGNGLGPLIVLSVEVLDIDFIFLCSVHTYEVIAINKGDIPGTIMFKQEPLVFGGKVEVLPNMRYLKPNEHIALKISFTSNRHGDFTEKLNFVVVESGEKVSFVLKGKIVSPTLHFEKTLIDFGTIPVGFSVSKEVTLSNLSMVPVTFSLKILNEGNQPSMSYEKFSKLTIKPLLPKFPREFKIDPVEGVVEPYSSRTVTLTLTANIARKWSTQLMVDMWDSETESVSCPIRFNSQIATVAVEPSTIIIPFCFINYPYTRLVTLENTSNISAFFYIIPQNPYEQKTMTYSANISQGVIPPKGTAKVSLTIMTNTLGRQTLPLNILTFGNDNPIDVCQICCVGQGPVVTVKPNSLEWGEVPLLQESTKYLTIINESPIPASFTITMAKAESPWVVSPSQSVLAPEEKITVNISLLLRDRGKYHDALKIQINNGKTLICSTSALGIGNSLLMQPNINGKYDLGTLFSHKKYAFEILLKNEGTKLIGIVWCPLDDFRTFASLKFVNPPDLVFKVEPAKVELPGGCSKIINLEVYSASSGSFSHFFYCYANAESFVKDLYMTTEVTAEFVEPLVQFDRTDLHFHYNISSCGVEEKFTDFVNVTNTSVLPLCVTAVVNPPFYIKGNSGQEIYKEELDIPGNKNRRVTVGFKASEDPDRRCHIYKDKLNITFKEHLKKTSIILIGEVNYPNVTILPRSVNFGCIPVAASAYREFIVVNVSPVTVNYTIKWEEKASSIVYIDSSETSSYFRKLSDDICCESHNKVSIISDEEPRGVTPEKSEQPDNFFPENNKDPESRLEILGLIPPKKPTLKIPEITIKESDVKNVMFPLVQKYYIRDEIVTNLRSSSSENVPERPAFMQFFDITPFYGRLEKYQTQVISICFEPNAAMKAHVQARLEIECGPIETIVINAKAADLDYLLNKIHIDFGRQFFWDISSDYLKIKNTSFLEFDFEANTVGQSEIEIDGDSPIEAGVLIITPRTGFVPALSEKSIRVQYHPGLPGKFEEKFQLRIGYLDPITILVSGFAVFPQVFFDLPRGEMSSIPVEIGYAAIASITPEWLSPETNYQSPSITPTLNSERMTENIRKDDIIEKDSETTEKWTVVNKNDCLLSQIDINLAIERILAFKVLSSASSRKGPLVFARSIPNFLVPPYEINFGIVTIGRSVEETFSVTNKGPLPAVLFFAPDKDHKNRVMQIKVRTRNEVKVGGTVQIAINFDPKRSRFTEQYEKIDYTFYFEVYQGARIPVRATAIVTYPFVTPSVKSLNFNEVTCGHCKVMSMKLKNFGWVPASWSLSFRLTSREQSIMHQSGILDGRLMFLFGTNKGLLFPNESFLLQITFKPEFGGKFGATMVIKVEGGFDDHKVLLSGESIEPRLKISETTITFEPTLPYPRKLYKYFTVQNASAFPIEFYLPDFDQQIKEEENVLRAMMLYYQTNELLLPTRNPGDKLPQELIDFYMFLLDNLNTKYIEKKREKLCHATNSPSSIFEFEESIESTEKKKTKVKRGSSAYRPRSSMIIHSHVNLPGLNQDFSIFKDKTSDEIQDMLHDYIRGCSSIEGRFDPLKSILDSVQIPRKTEALEPIQGTVIILHTAPRTNSVLFAKLFESTFKKQVFSIDGIVLEEAALVRCPAGILLRSIIEQTYVDHIESKNSTGVEESTSQVFSKKQTKETLLEDILEDLEKKIDQLFLLRNELTRKSYPGEEMISSTGSSKKEKEKTQTPNVKWVPQTGGILEGLENLVFEIVRFRVQMEAVTGVLVENLNSNWINNPVAVLKLLIKASGNVSNIFVICLMCSFDKYKEFIMQKEANDEKILSSVKEEVLKTLEKGEEDIGALPLSPEEIKEIYAKFLNNRRDDYKKFLTAMKEKAQQRNMKKFPSKKAPLSPSNASLKAQQSGPQKEKLLLESNSKDAERFKDKEKATRSGISTRVKSVKKEEEQEEMLFLAFEEQLMEIRNFLEFWDRKLGISVEVQSAKIRKTTSPKKMYSAFEVEKSRETLNDVGVPLWLIDENNLESTLVECVCGFLKQILTNRRVSFDAENWAVNVPPSVTYAVVAYPPNRHPTNMLDVFGLYSTDRSTSLSLPEDENILKTIPEDKYLKIDSDQSLSVGKRNSEMVKPKVESRMSTTGKYTRPKKSFGSYAGESQPIKSRWILQEGESTIWCAQFSPKKTGTFEQIYAVNLVTEPINNNYIIKCTGICDIPRLDMNPENIFSSIAPEKPQDYIYSPTFFYSNYCFDFGSVIPNQLKDEGHNRELHSIFSLTNISALPVELLVMFADDALRETPIGSPHFDIAPKKGYLKPYQTFLLNVYANPSKYGSTQEELMLFIKGNPKVETIKIKCYGVRVSVNIEPKFIDFDRMLLYRKAKRAITFTNSNLIPLFIALSGYNKLPPQFTFSATKSWIQPLMSFTIEIEYEASEVQVISEEIIQVLVYDRVEAVNPVQTLSFPVSAEAYDASVDIFFASKDDYHVDFEEIRIQNEHRKSVTLKNTGKYILGFKIDIDYDLLEENGNEEFFLSPEEGKLPVGKAVPLTVHFQARTEVNWVRLPLFRITLTEPYNNNELVASIPIEVSARSFFSRCVIQPLSELNIGPVLIGSQKTVKLSIENKGQFSFVYSIEPASMDLPLPDVEEDLNKKSARKPSEASSKEKVRKVLGGSLKAGCFEITPNSGTVDVKQTVVVNVHFCPTEVQHYEEVVIVKVSESPPHQKDGNELKIVAEGCIPELNLDDFESIFREHQVKRSGNDIQHLPDIGYQTIFNVDTKQLCFKNACLGKTVEARLHLENRGQIDCHVMSSINKLDGKRSRSLIELEIDSFSIKPQELIISPYASGTFTISFTPEMLQLYRCQLMLSLQKPEKYASPPTIFNLFATVCSPEVEIIEPFLRSPDGQGLVIFTPTTPGRTSVSPISFKNVGKIESKVILEIYQSEEDIFTAEPKPETETMLKAWELNKSINHTVLVTVQPGETAEFNVFFKPLEIKKYSSEIKLLIIDNGFKNLSYKLSGEAFLEEIVLEKIQTTMPFAEENPLDSSSCQQTVPGQYCLNLGHCFINKKKKFLARLSNKTNKDYFKFEWEEVPASLTVQPSVGHLYPGTYKEILFTFLPQDNLEMEEVPLTCSLKKIQYPIQPEGPSWDSRLVHYQSATVNETDSHISKIRASSQQEMIRNEVQVSGQEPNYEVIPDSDSELIIFVSAVADYAHIFCETTVINFADTFMFQNRCFPLALENRGNVAFDYTLELVSVTYKPLKVDRALQVNPMSLLNLRPTPRTESKSAPPKRKIIKRKDSLDASKPRPLDSESLLELFPEHNEESNVQDMALEKQIEPYNPIHLENFTGTIMPKEKAFCHINFSPLDVYEYNGIIRIKVDNIHPDQVLPDIEVNARSIMPYCHFELPESDYIQNGRRDYSRPGPVGSCPGVPLDPQVKAIEIRILGIKVVKPIHFHAINPTDSDYSFSWVNVTQNQPGTVQSLHCTYLDGTIQAGRQKLMEFVFVSQTPGTFEYFWKFWIPQHQIEMIFLFVIIVQEPVMYFLKNHLTMRPTSIGATVSDVVTLVNEDDVSSDFFFVPNSLYSDGRLNALKVQPLSGTINPKSEVNFRISFVGKTAGNVLFHLKCKIKKLQSPLKLTVETTTHTVEPLITFEDLSGGKHIADPSMNNVIDFGKELHTEQTEKIKIFLTSTSKLSFFYEWVYDKRELVKHNCSLSFSKAEGQVFSFSREECDLCIIFSKKSVLASFPIKLKITRGPTYSFLVSASAISPAYEFSFLSYDFGYSYIQTTEYPFYEKNLIFKNKDKNELLLESSSENLKNFTFVLEKSRIKPGKELLIPIRFYPKEPIKYEEEISFVVSGLFQKVIPIFGHGTEFKVTLTNVADANIYLGATRVGCKQSKTFSVVNKGLAPATILIGFADQLPVNLSCLARPEENSLDLPPEYRLANILSLSPSRPVTLRPKESCAFKVEYTPQQRTSSFTETVCMQFQERVEPLCVITGSSVGPQFSLDKKYLAFGAVVANYSSTLKLKIINSGDIGARFKWETEYLDGFSVYPETGYLSAESDFLVEVSFHPRSIRNCIKNTVECKLFISDTETYPSLFLKLSGDCVDLPQPSKSVFFSCDVRNLDIKTIEIHNRTGTDWRLVPIFSGEYFNGLDLIFVPSISSAEYEITYTPLKMTQENNPHQGSLFFCLPDGTGQLYNLVGTALPPPPSEIIEREVPCKTKYTELLKVTNWLRSHQRFTVTRTYLDNENSDDLVFTCSGNDIFELAPSAEKEYKLNFYAYKFGKLHFNVNFTNEETKEYIWFDITFNVVMCGPLEVITLKSRVRQTCFYGLKLENPLDEPVQYKIDCSNPEILIPAVDMLQPKSTGVVDIGFRPLRAYEKTEQLKASCPELGIFPMELRLIALEAPPEECTVFEAPLGSTDSKTVCVRNYHNSQAILNCKTDSEEFRADERVSVPGQDSASIEIIYEPFSIGQSVANLFIESENAGNFIFPLVGNSLKPLAKGPYVLKSGTSLSIPFKNVLRELKSFQIYVDNPAFSVRSSLEEIPPGSEIKLIVSLQKISDAEKVMRDSCSNVRYPVMGQLVVECFSPHIKWQYYLKGVA